MWTQELVQLCPCCSCACTTHHSCELPALLRHWTCPTQRQLLFTPQKCLSTFWAGLKMSSVSRNVRQQMAVRTWAATHCPVILKQVAGPSRPPLDQREQLEVSSDTAVMHLHGQEKAHQRAMACAAALAGCGPASVVPPQRGCAMHQG